MEDRDWDIKRLEIRLKNDELERRWYLDKLGIRARYMNAEDNRQISEEERTYPEGSIETPYA